MKTARKALSALVVAGIATAAGPAFAAAYSTATFGKVTITLIDLDPNDGISANISFLNDPIKFDGGAFIRGMAETGMNSGNEPGNQLKNFKKTGAWQTTSFSDSAITPLAVASGSVTGSATGAGFSALSLTGSALSTAEQRANYAAYGAVPGLDYRGFVLSANTKVVFSVDASVSAQTTIGHTPGGLEGEAASALLSLYAGGYAANGVTVVEDLQEHGASVLHVDGSPDMGAADAWSGVMSASFSNLSSHSTEGGFYAHAAISGNSVISAVPEPSTYGMLLGGLAMMGALLRRRRNRAV
jgi:hypothetical protein